MEEINRYEKYKDSGIEWIGEIPEHWDIKRVKFIISNELGIQIGPFGSSLRSEFIRNVGYKIYGQENVIKDDFTLGYKYLDEDKFNELIKYELFPGDIVITMMGTTGKCKIVPENIEKGIMDSHLIRIRVNNDKILEKFFAVLINDSYSIMNNIKYESKGSIMEGLNSSIIKSLYIPLPNINEQSSIINFIYRKTAEIDQIIANKQKLIALYEEEKQAIINQAVTKGLDKNVELKDSGVEWLGEIPEHWEVKKLNYCFRQIGSGTTPTSGKPEYYENGEFNWLQTGDLNDSEITETSKKITQKALDDNSTLRFYPIDSIVIAMYGATIGKTGFLKIETTTNQACCVLSKPKNMFPKFVFYWFNAVKKHIISLSYGGGQPNINQEQIRSLKIQQPPINEQKLIVVLIENELNRLSVIIEKFNKQIDLLQEYRTTLISEVVTGKIKVPNTIES